MYAIVRTGGKQYRVAKDTKVTVERLSGEIGDVITLDDVLFINTGKDSKVGSPVVSGASVEAEIVEQGRADKIIVFKKKRRQNYRRKQGHRQHETVLRITDLKSA